MNIQSRLGLTLAVVLLACISFAWSFNDTFPYIQNLDDRCLNCICYAVTECDLGLGCSGGYCGAYKISRVYWIDAGRPTIPGDDPDRNNAFSDCSIHFDCAQLVVKGYMKKFGRDCNYDGLTNCIDYLMLHVIGGIQCTGNLDKSESGRLILKRFEQCVATT